MKKALLFIIITLWSIIGYSQVYKFRAFRVAMFPTDEDVKSNNPTTWDSVNLLIVINMDKNKVHIYAEKETDVDIVRLINTFPDKDNKEITWIFEQGVDQDGKDCKIITRLMPPQPSGYTAVLFLEYPIATYGFKLKKNE